MSLPLAALLAFASAPQAETAQAAFDAWRAGLPALPVPITQSLDLEASFAVEGFDPDADPELMQLDGMRFTMAYSVAQADLRRYRLDVDFRSKMPGLDAGSGLVDFSAQAGLSADGETLRAWGEIDLAAAGGVQRGAARMTQSEVEALYALMRTSLPALAAQDAGASPGLMSGILSLYPEQFGAYFHPANYVGQMVSLLAVKECERKEGRVRADCLVDPAREPLAVILAEMRRLSAEEPEGVRVMDGLIAAMEMIRIELTFDEATGVALSGSVRADMPVSLFAPAATGKVRFEVEFHTEDFSTGEIPTTRLTAPAEGWEWFDADPFLMLAKMQLQSIAPDPSDGDLEF